MKEQIKKKHGNSGVIFCPYVSNVFVKDPKKEENQWNFQIYLTGKTAHCVGELVYLSMCVYG